MEKMHTEKRKNKKNFQTKTLSTMEGVREKFFSYAIYYHPLPTQLYFVTSMIIKFTVHFLCVFLKKHLRKIFKLSNDFQVPLSYSKYMNFYF